MELLRDTKRDWEILKEEEKIRYVLTEKLRSQHFHLKGTDPPLTFSMGEFTPAGIEFFPPMDLEAPSELTLYLTVKRHIEIDFRVVEVKSDRWVLFPVLARISKAVRMHPRIIPKEGDVYAANFKISKNELGGDLGRLQIASQVVLRDLEKQLASDYPGLRIYLNSDRDRPPDMRPLDRLMTPLVIRDTRDAAAYDVPVEDSTFRQKLEELRLFEQARLRLSDARGLIVFPITLEEKEQSHLVAHMHVPIRQPDVDYAMILQDLAEKSGAVVERIRELNMVSIKDKQRVADVSLGGVALEVTNPELLKYVPTSDRITFDLIFKMQAPLRFQGKITHVAAVDGTTMKAGINIEGSGHSDAKKSVQDRLGSLLQLIRTDKS